MCKKTFGMLLLGATSLFCSCVDDTYDLANKELSMDVKIVGNKLALPLGSLRTVFLDSLISLEKLDILDKRDGVYSISMADTIDPYEYEMSEIKFTMPPKKTNVPISDFAKADITQVDIKGVSPEDTKFDVPAISLDDLKIPDLNSDATASVANDEVKGILGQYAGNQLINVLPEIEFVHKTFSIENEKVPFDLDYQLPEQIKSISTIWLKTAGDNAISTKGALVSFEIKHPEAMLGLEKSMEFEIDFPDEFFLELDNTAEGSYVLTNGGHGLKVTNLVAEAGSNESTIVSFYINRLDELDKNIENGVLKLDESVNYTVRYAVNGKFKLTTEHRLSDFDFKVSTNLGLAFRDVKGMTNDITIDFAPITMDFDIDLDNLQYIDQIEYIDFNAAQSKLHFHTVMEGGFSPFSLKEGYALKLEFPKELIIDEALSEYPRQNKDGETAVVYNADEHAFYIYDIEIFDSIHGGFYPDGVTPIYGHWNLALDRFDLYEPVVDGEFHHTVEAKVSVVNNNETVNKLELSEVMLESLSSTLESFKSKDVRFAIWNSHFEIDDAVVHTEVIKSPLNHTREFDFENNDLPKEIRRIESIGFDGDVPVYFKIKINGLEELNTHVTLDLHVKLPSALDLSVASDSKGVTIVGDSLIMKLDMDPSSQEPATIAIQCNGLDFTKGEQGNALGLRPELKNDKGYIQYKSDIVVVGNVLVDGMDFHADVLDSDISVDVEFEMGDIKVKDFHGIFHIDDLGTVEESIDLNLGEGLDFLKNEENTLVLSDPQITVEVDNSISIPVSAKFSLVGRDENGGVIPTSIIEHFITINPAEYNKETDEVTPSVTRLLFTSKPMMKEGYDNVTLENLSNLLKQIPATIDITLVPVIDTTQTQNVNLMQPLSFGGNYAVVIPLQFDEFNFVYSDTIAGLQADLGTTLEMFSNMEVGLDMNVKNSLPLQLQLKAIPLDENGDTISGISIPEFEIPAGSGQAFNDTIKGQKVELSVKSSTTDGISQLDRLKFDVHASATSTVGGAALRGEQGIKLDDITIRIAGDIEMDLNDMTTDK